MANDPLRLALSIEDAQWQSVRYDGHPHGGIGVGMGEAGPRVSIIFLRCTLYQQSPGKSLGLH